MKREIDDDDIGAMPITNKTVVAMFVILFGAIMFYAAVILGLIYVVSKL